jgi:nicotinate-nucleotide adenylyltransferase
MSPLSPDHPPNLVPPMQPQIALFGTSADPPTLGHQRILQWLSTQFDHVAVWASDNPFKNHRASLADRHNLLQCLIADCQQADDYPRPPTSSALGSPLRPTPLRLQPDLSYPRSLDTLAAAQQRWPEARFTFVIGSDLLPQIANWYQADRLLGQVQLLVIPRPGAPIVTTDRHRVEALGSPITIAPISGLPISSSAYRSGDRQTVSPRVAHYIQTHQLYTLCHESLNDRNPDRTSHRQPSTARHLS